MEVSKNFDEYNLNSRILLHTKFSTNPTNWFDWIFTIMNIQESDNILELGAGSGEMWVRTAINLPLNTHITVSDISGDFVAQCKERLVDCPKNYMQFSFETVDIYNIPYTNKFNKILANTMIYHCIDLDSAIKQIKKALKTGGAFYCTTAEKNHLKELKTVVQDFDASCVFPLNGESERFSRENGLSILSNYFKEVQLIDFDNALIINDFDLFIEFISSFKDDPNFYLEPILKDTEQFKRYLQLKFKKGYLQVTKSNCMFLAKSAL